MSLPVHERVKLAVEAYTRLCRHARQDFTTFYELVMREETTRARLKAAPHQRVIMRFIEDHPRCVLRLPPGFTKTYVLSAFTLKQLGENVTSRGVVISGTVGQAAKPLAMVRDTIESSPDLRVIYPALVPSQHPADPWTQHKITVNRPRGIRDPSLSAVGFRGKLPGSRLNWLFVDDLMNLENTATPEMRQEILRWFLNTVISRRDVKGKDFRCVVSNTPYHPEDLTYELEKAGWPVLEMTISGDIRIINDDAWDSDDIRPSHVKDGVLRLSAHDHPRYDPAKRGETIEIEDERFFDEADEVPLWPEHYGLDRIEELRRLYVMQLHEYYRLYEMRVRDESSSRVKVEWIDACKKRARDAGVYTMAQDWRLGRTFTGVDLGVGKKRKNDRTSIFTFGLQPDGSRILLRITAGRWSGTEIIQQISNHHRDFDSIIRVETNAAQDFLKQWAVSLNRALPIKGHNTNANKWSKEHGVESLFIELENTAWLIPNTPDGKVAPEVQQWINEVLYYDPSAHTGDTLMASWLARLQAGRAAMRV